MDGVGGFGVCVRCSVFGVWLIRHPSSVIRHPSSVIRHPTPVIRLFAGFRLCLASVTRHPAPGILHPTSCTRHPAPGIGHRSPGFTNPATNPSFNKMDSKITCVASGPSSLQVCKYDVNPEVSRNDQLLYS